MAPRRLLTGLSLFFSASLIATIIFYFTGDIEIAGVAIAADMLGNLIIFFAGGLFFTSLTKKKKR